MTKTIDKTYTEQINLCFAKIEAAVSILDSLDLDDPRFDELVNKIEDSINEARDVLSDLKQATRKI